MYWKKIDIAYEQINDMKENINFIKPDMEKLGILKEFISFTQEENIIEETLSKLKKLDLLSIRGLKSEKKLFYSSNIIFCIDFCR